MGEFFAEIFGGLFVEVFAEVFAEASFDFGGRRYIPKWLRMLTVTVIFAIPAVIVAAICKNNNTLFIILMGLTVILYLIFLVKSLRVKNNRYERAVLNDGYEFVGKRDILGAVTGDLSLRHSSEYVADGGNKIKVEFTVDDSVEKHDRKVKFIHEEKEFLEQLRNQDFIHITMQARGKLTEKLSKKGIVNNNGKELKLCRVRHIRNSRNIEISYIFKDNISGKKIYVTETKDVSVYV